MRDVVVVIVAALIVGAAGYLAFDAVADRTDGSNRPGPEDVAAGYATAWESWDVETMAGLVRGSPEDFDRLHREMRDALAPRSTSVSVTGLDVDGQVGTASLAVEIGLPGADVFDYDTTLDLQREHGTWEVLWTPETLHPRLRTFVSWEIVTTDPVRAPILARDGTSLTAHGEVHTIGVEPRRILDVDRLVETFRTQLPEAADDLEDLLARGDLHPTWFYPVVTLQQDRFDAVWDYLRPIDGIIHRAETGRTNLGEGFARHVLGTVGEITAEKLEELGPPYAPGDEVGLFGLEAAYEEQLTGSQTFEVRLVEDDGDVWDVVHSYSSDPPTALETTLDTTVQQAIENALTGYSRETAIVAIDANTGAIRGVASRPLEGFNRAFDGRYLPGSTFLTVTAAALLEHGATVDDTVTCPARTVVASVRIDNHAGLDLGETPFDRAFAAGCETTFGGLAVELTPAELEAMARSFGFGADYDLPLALTGGSFTEPSSDVEQVAAAIGDANVASSPLHLATVAAAVADGTWRTPWLVADGDPAGDGEPLPSATATGLRRLWRLAASTGAARDIGATGGDVLGVVGRGRAAGGGHNGWALGVREDLAFAVIVEQSEQGGLEAGRLAVRFLNELASLSGRTL